MPNHSRNGSNTAKAIDFMFNNASEVGTFFKPDLSLIFQCTPRTTYERMAEKKDMQGKFPPAELHAAYDLIARALTGGDKRHPFGKSYTSDLPISGGNGVYRIVTDLPHNLTRSEELKFYQRIKSFIAETIATDFNATYRLRFDRKNDALNLQKKNKQRVRN